MKTFRTESSGHYDSEIHISVEVIVCNKCQEEDDNLTEISRNVHMCNSCLAETDDFAEPDDFKEYEEKKVKNLKVPQMGAIIIF